MESVQVRQRGAYDFETHYESVCTLHNCCPLPAVKAHLSQGILDLHGDRISSVEWKPILSSLSINKSLEFVAVTCSQGNTEKGKENNEPKSKHKQPAIRGKEVTHELCKAIKKCLLVTPALACLKLQGLPLRESDILYLAKGLNKNSSLNYLSLTYCRIKDNGLETIARAIKNNMTLNAINLTGCGLTWQGAETLARIIKHQAMCRHGEAWKDSLRYRRPDLERMSGLRRITLNNNPLIEDHGALVLAEALRDDLWLKALDLQCCGISKVGAKAFSDMLLYNTTLVILDVRANPLIDRMLIHSITEQVMLNAKAIETTDNSEPDYDWIKLQQATKMEPKRKKKVTKILNNSFTKKTSIRINGMRYNLKNARSNSSLRGKAGSTPVEVPQPGRGMPWRTAARAIKQRGCFSSHEEYYGPDGSMEIIADPDLHSKMPIDKVRRSPLSEKKQCSGKKNRQVLSPFNSKDNENILNGIAMMKNLKVELEHVKRELAQERLARQAADKNVLELTLENERLLVLIEQMQKRRNEKKDSILDDEKVLEAIETSFKQFHSFLDVLRNAGFGELIRVAGLDDQNLITNPQIQLSCRPKTNPSNVEDRIRSSLKNSWFGDSVPLADSQDFFKNQQEPLQTDSFGPSLNDTLSCHHPYVQPQEEKNMSGAQKSFFDELNSMGRLSDWLKKPKDQSTTGFGLAEPIGDPCVLGDFSSGPLTMGSPQMGSSHMAQGQIGPSHMGSPQMGSSQIGQSHMAQGQIGPSHMGSPQMGQSHMGPSHMGSPKMRPCHMGSPKMESPKRGPPKMRPSHIEQPHIGSPQRGQPHMESPKRAPSHIGQPHMGSPKLGSPQMGPSHIGPSQMAPSHIGPSHIGPSQKGKDGFLNDLPGEDLENSLHLWEKTKTLVNGKILTKPKEQNNPQTSSPPHPLLPSSPKSLAAANYWLENSFDRAKIVDDILKKTHLKPDEEFGLKAPKPELFCGGGSDIPIQNPELFCGGGSDIPIQNPELFCGGGSDIPIQNPELFSRRETNIPTEKPELFYGRGADAPTKNPELFCGGGSDIPIQNPELYSGRGIDIPTPNPELTENANRNDKGSKVDIFQKKDSDDQNLKKSKEISTNSKEPGLNLSDSSEREKYGMVSATKLAQMKAKEISPNSKRPGLNLLNYENKSVSSQRDKYGMDSSEKDKYGMVPATELAQMKTKEMSPNSKKRSLNLLDYENKSISSEKDKYGMVPATELAQIQDLAEIRSNSVSHEISTNNSLKAKDNGAGRKSPSLNSQTTKTRNSKASLLENTKDGSWRQTGSLRDDEIPEMVLSEQTPKRHQLKTDSTDSSDTDESFSLGTIDLSQVSNQCDTPAHSNIHLDSIQGLDDMNSQDTSPFKSMSDEDF